jgi:hypothetical protein
MTSVKKDILIDKMEKLEAKLKTLEFLVTRSAPLAEYMTTLSQTTELVEDLKSIIERENF